MTEARDTGAERLGEYARLFAVAYLGRDRPTAGVMQWWFRADPGIEAWVNDLAARENACCGFMRTTVWRRGDEVIWEASTIDDPDAHRVLDLMYDLPDSSEVSVDEMFERFDATGVPIVVRDGDVSRPVGRDDEVSRRGRGGRR